MVKSKTGKRNENRGESFITFKERKFGEGDNHPKKFRAAKKWEIGERRINELCLNGRIKGAVKFGNTWAIPADSEKPADARIKSGKYIKDRGDRQ